MLSLLVFQHKTLFIFIPGFMLFDSGIHISRTFSYVQAFVTLGTKLTYHFILYGFQMSFTLFVPAILSYVHTNMLAHANTDTDISVPGIGIGINTRYRTNPTPHDYKFKLVCPPPPYIVSEISNLGDSAPRTLHVHNVYKKHLEEITD